MTVESSEFTRLSALAGAGAAGRQTAHEFVRSVLRRAILSGELAGGTRLVQAELAAVLEVSTTPVREALRELASEGLVRFDPHRGAVVQELSGEELAEIYAIREVLEPLALRRAVPNLTPGDLARLRQLHERMLVEPHSEEWVDANRAFHTAVLEAAASPRLCAIIRSLEDASVMYIGASLNEVPGLREDAVADHGEFLEALEAGDVEAAVAVAVRHLGLAVRAFESRNAPKEET
jgi:DNA-binding GntR family transcriptional regulator